MSQPQPCAHEFDEMYFCARCGQPAERVVDLREQFGACWRGVLQQLRDCETLAYRGPIPWRTS